MHNLKRFLVIFIIYIFQINNGYSQEMRASIFLNDLRNNYYEDSIVVIKLDSAIEAENDDNIWPLYNDELLKITGEIQKSNKYSMHYFAKKYYAKALNNKGYFYKINGNINLALEYYSKSLKIKEEIKDVSSMPSTLNNIGNIYQNYGDIPLALEYFHKSLSIIERELNQTSDAAQKKFKKKEFAIFLNNIGLVYSSQGDTAQALEYYNKSLQVRNSINDKVGYAQILNNIGAIYHKHKNTQKSLEYFNLSLNLRDSLGDKSGVAISLNNIGKVYYSIKDFKKAATYFEKSLNLRYVLNDRNGISLSLISLSMVNLELNKIDEALSNALEAYKISIDLGFPENMSQSAEILKLIYLKKNNYKKAYEYYEIEVKQKNQIENEKNFKSTQMQQARYEYKKKSAIDSIAHKKVLEIKTLELEKINQEKKAQQKITFFIAIGFIIVFGLLLLVLHLFNQKRKSNIELELKNEKISLQKEEIDSQNKSLNDANILIQAYNKNITDSIRYAQRMQSAMLPPISLIKQCFSDSFVFYKPKSIVSGDFYWLHSNEKFVYIAVADCTGHGVPGALLSMLGFNLLNQSIKEIENAYPYEILNFLVSNIAKMFHYSNNENYLNDGMDIAICRFEMENKILNFAGLKNSTYLIRNKELIELKGTKLSNINNHEFKFEKSNSSEMKLYGNDQIFMATDGFADQFNENSGKKFSTAQFKSTLIEISDLSPNEQSNKLLEIFEKWKGNSEQIDDVTVMGIKI